MNKARQQRHTYFRSDRGVLLTFNPSSFTCLCAFIAALLFSVPGLAQNLHSSPKNLRSPLKIGEQAWVKTSDWEIPAGFQRADLSLARTQQEAGLGSRRQDSAQELRGRYNALAMSVRSLFGVAEARARLGPSHRVRGPRGGRAVITLFAERPGSIRVIGPPLLGAPSFEAATNGQTTRLYLPLRHRLYVARGRVVRLPNSFEALDPNGIAQAIFWRKIPPQTTVHAEDCVDCRSGEVILYWQADRAGGRKELLRAFFDKESGDLCEIRVLGKSGALRTDVHYSDWSSVAGPTGKLRYPHTVRLHSVTNDYRLELQFSRITLNPRIPPSRLRIGRVVGAREILLQGEETPKVNLKRPRGRPKD